MNENGEKIIVAADPRLRKQILISVLIIILIALVIWVYLQKYFLDLNLLAQDNPNLAIAKAVQLVHIFLLINNLVFLALGIYLVTIGLKIFRSQQYPPPGQRVVRDTVLVSGKKARVHAFFLWVIAFLLIILVVLINFFVNSFAQSLF